MATHHTLEVYLDEYVKAAGIATNLMGALFRSSPDTVAGLINKPVRTGHAWRMIHRRGQTGRNFYQDPLPQLPRHRHHQIPAARRHPGKSLADDRPHQPRTTKLYDRTNDQISLDEVEKIRLLTTSFTERMG